MAWLTVDEGWGGVDPDFDAVVAEQVLDEIAAHGSVEYDPTFWDFTSGMCEYRVPKRHAKPQRYRRVWTSPIVQEGWTKPVALEEWKKPVALLVWQRESSTDFVIRMFRNSIGDLGMLPLRSPWTYRYLETADDLASEFFGTGLCFRDYMKPFFD